jgi:phosphohistidine phosphatase SixA
MSRLALALVLLVSLPAHAAGDLSLKTIVVVRHAEAEPESAGPQRQLTAQGQKRAQELARVLAETPLKAVYSTQLARSRLTAEPVARAAGAPLIALEDTGKTLAALSAAPWGSTTVVVGHSNTVPDIVAGVTHQPFPANLPVTHDRIWIMTLARDGQVSVVRLRYGEPDAMPPPQAR